MRRRSRSGQSSGTCVRIRASVSTISTHGTMLSSALQFVGKLARLRAISIAAAGCGRPSCWLSMIWKVASRRAKANPIIGFLTDCVSCSSSDTVRSNHQEQAIPAIEERFRKHDHQFVKPATSGRSFHGRRSCCVYIPNGLEIVNSRSPRCKERKPGGKEGNSAGRQLVNLIGCQKSDEYRVERVRERARVCARVRG